MSICFNKLFGSNGFLNFVNGVFSANVARRLQHSRATLLEVLVGHLANSFESRNSDMNKLTILATAMIAVGAAAPAVAADLPARAPATYTKAPAIVQAAYDWSGFYIGINGGGATGNVDWNADGFGDEGSHHPSGGTVGGQIGYRWQMSSWVFGLEAQGNWADFKGSNTSLLGATNPLFANTTNSTKIDSFGLFTGQI